MQVLRNRAAMQCEHRLDQPGRAGGGLQVPDIRLDRTDEQGMIGFASPAVDAGRGVDLDWIADGRPGPVRLEIVDLRRRDPRPGERRLDHLFQGGRVGHRQAGAGASVVDRRAPDDRPDPVAVGLGVAQPLQDHHAAPFAPHVPVRGRIESLAPPVGRQHHRLRAQLVDVTAQHRLDAARDGQIRLALLKIGHRVMERDQGRRAGRIHRLRRPHQPEDESDPSAGAVQVGAAEGVQACRRPGGPARIHDQHSVLVVADPGIDPGKAPPEPVRVDARIFERFPAGLQHHALLRIQELRLRRGNPEEGCVKQLDVVDETAETAGRVANRIVGEQLSHAAPAGTRHPLGDRVAAGFQQAPEGVEVSRSGEAAGHADDRDRLADAGAPGSVGVGSWRRRFGRGGGRAVLHGSTVESLAMLDARAGVFRCAGPDIGDLTNI